MAPEVSWIWWAWTSAPWAMARIAPATSAVAVCIRSEVAERLCVDSAMRSAVACTSTSTPSISSSMEEKERASSPVSSSAAVASSTRRSPREIWLVAAASVRSGCVRRAARIQAAPSPTARFQETISTPAQTGSGTRRGNTTLPAGRGA